MATAVLEAELPSQSERSRGKKPHVLVVDDSQMTCMLIRMMLSPDYRVTMATSIAEALQQAAAHKIDVALLDIALGEERTGADLLHLLRRIDGYQTLPAIASTAYALPDSRARFLEAGFNEYLGKPVRKSDILRALEACLRPTEASSSGSERIAFTVPPPPATFPEVMRLLQLDEDPRDTEALVKVMRQDPVASIWVMKHVNSAYYGLWQKATSIERAIALLGYDPICNLVLTEMVTRRFTKLGTERARHLYTAIMRVSLATAAFARALATHLELPKIEIAYTAGLLHQLGRMALLSSEEEAYGLLWHEAPGGNVRPPPLEEERRRFGQDYVHIGADIARAWKLSDQITTILRFHQDPQWVDEKALADLAYVVAAAGRAASNLYGWVDPSTEAPPNYLDDLARRMKRDGKDLRAVLEAAEDDVKEFVRAAF